MSHQPPGPSVVGALGNDPSETAAPPTGSAAEQRQPSGDGEPGGSNAKAKETAGPKPPTHVQGRGAGPQPEIKHGNHH